MQGYHPNDLQRLFSLAYTSHPDRAVAQCVVIEGIVASNDIRVAEKRRIREAKKRKRTPNKLIVPNIALPQVGVFIASAGREHDQESSQPKKEPLYKPTPSDNLPRYVEHLVYRTIDRWPCYMLFGMGVHLYAYNPGQIALLSDELITSDNYRRTNDWVREHIQERFPSCTGRHPASASEKVVTFNLLDRFAPWIEGHHLPSNWKSSLYEAFSPPREALTGREGNDLMWVLNHLVVNPKSGGLHRLIQEYNQHAEAQRANGFDDVMLLDNPEDKLAPPTFPDSPNATDDRFNPPPLTQDETKLMERHVAAICDRRRRYSPRQLRVLVDGRQPQNYYGPERLSSHITISPYDAYIQVVGEDEEGELPLAVFQVPDLESMEAGECEELFITHSGGQVITCQIEATRDEAGEIRGDVRVTQTTPRRLFQSWSDTVQLLRDFSLPGVSLVTAALIIAAILITGFLCLKHQGAGQHGSVVKDSSGTSGAKVSDNDVIPQPINMAYNAVGNSLLTPAVYKPSSTDPSSTYDVSDQKAGSVLIFNYYTSNTESSNVENTRINLTNTNTATAAFVHLFFVEGGTCSIADSFLCLTANQTASFLASDVDPGITGYVVAVAVDNCGLPADFDWLMGDQYVRLASGHAANLGAEVFSASDVPPSADFSLTEAVLAFNGVAYNMAPRVLAMSNITSGAGSNCALVVISRIGGDPVTDAATFGTLFGWLYDDVEKAPSFSTNIDITRAKPLPHTVGRSGWEGLSKAIGASELKATLESLQCGKGSVNKSDGARSLDDSPRTVNIKLAIPVISPSSWSG